jgi:murein DD-endopeptidase MepM/ murein hydrolase activator NlpD
VTNFLANGARGVVIAAAAATMTFNAVPLAFAGEGSTVESCDPTLDGSDPLLAEAPALEPNPAATPDPEDCVEEVKADVQKVTQTVEELVKPGDPDDPSATEPSPDEDDPPGIGDGSKGDKSGHGPGPKPPVCPPPGETDEPPKQIELRPAGSLLDSNDAAKHRDDDWRWSLMPQWEDRVPPPGWYNASMMSSGPFLSGEYSQSTGLRSTSDIVAALGTEGGSAKSLATALAPFPVAGPANYSDDFGAPRSDGRSHAGTDIFAARGTPVIASDDGVVTAVGHQTPLGGNSVGLTGVHGTYYYYAHLDFFASGISPGQRVEKGSVLGYVGNTGNALTTPSHLHYEIHPDGGPPVNPVPFLDRWLAQARERIGDAAVQPPVAAPPLVDTAALSPAAVERRQAFPGALAEFASTDQGAGRTALLVFGALLLALLSSIPAFAAPRTPD